MRVIINNIQILNPMKKSFILLIVLTIVFSFSSKVNAQSVDLDFESWANANENRDWSTGISLGSLVTLQFGTRSTDKHSGTYALQIQPQRFHGLLGQGAMNIPGICQLGRNKALNLGITQILALLELFSGDFDITDITELGTLVEDFSDLIGPGFPISRTPESVEFWTKFQPASEGDTISITVIATAWNSTTKTSDLVAYGMYIETSSIPEYQKITLGVDPITPNIQADTLKIIISCGGSSPNLNTKMWIDDMKINGAELSLTASVSEFDNGIICNIFPNPAVGKITVSPENQNKEYALRVYDIQGKMIWEKLQLIGEVELDITQYVAGAYLFELNQDNKKMTKKIVIE